MDKQNLEPNVKKKRKQGQTLAEFAITLPLLLILIFGIIEFGRLFQSWVTLQNAARRAARFASTGDYNREFFTDVDALIGCDPGDARGAQTSAGVGDPVIMYSGGEESIFATVYGGLNCDVGKVKDDEYGQGTEGPHGYLRRDILRIASIQMEARAGLAGLALPEYEFANTRAYFEQSWRSLWNHRPDLGFPSAESQEQRWVNVTVCSSRPFFDPYTGTGGSTPYNPEWGNNSRFYTDPTNNMCFLNEVPSAEALAAGAPNNGGAPWADAGEPGNTVTVIVTYNHPLVTPLGFARYVPISATRASVVESFRSAQAVDALQGGPSLTTGFPTATPSHTALPTNTALPTSTPSATFTKSVTPTASATRTFDCDLLHVEELRFTGQRVWINFRNENPQPASLSKVYLNWRDDNPSVTMSVMAIGSQVHWTGQDNSSPTQTDAEGTFHPSDRPVVPGIDNVAEGLDTTLWEGVFTNLPVGLLSDYMSPYHFAGSTFTFVDPDNPGTECVKTLFLPPPPPTNTPNPNSPTPTYTPDCAGTQVRIRFQEFLPFGVVSISIQNNRNVVAPFSAFDINWRKVNSSLILADVRIGGTTPSDPVGTTIWTSNSFSEDANPRTKGGTPTGNTQITGPYEGVWAINGPYNIPPNSTVFLWINFDGTGSRLNEIGMTPSDFNTTRFEIGCGTQGGGGGGVGGNPSGVIQIDQIPTPAPTNTVGPTNTPRPTHTPSKTYTPGPPTKTYTPAPPTRTFTPAPATNTRRPTDIPLPTSDDSGNND